MQVSGSPQSVSTYPLTIGLENPAHLQEFLNRDLSWLAFNQRVLQEALDERTPLLERVRFLAIFNANLDEFVQKRVGGIKRQLAAGVSTRTQEGLTPRDLLMEIRKRIEQMQQTQADCYTQIILPRLAQHGIHLLPWSQLTQGEQQWARAYFRANLFPVLTPLAVDPGHPFPFISNLSLSLGVLLKLPQHIRSLNHDADKTESSLQFARVKVPSMFPRWVRLPNPSGVTDPYRFVSLEQIIRHNLSDLFEGMEIVEVEPFRITRNAEVDRDEEDAEDLLELIEQELRDRRFAKVVRLQMDAHPNPEVRRFLMEQLELEDLDVFSMPAELDYTSLFAIADLPLPELKHESWTPIVPPRLLDDEADMFSLIRQGDILVHHPYESFKASVERFISGAARDPKVVALKATLYRTTPDAPFIVDLIHAAESGKQVVALVEIKARFDEELNLRIAQRLEKAGVHVVYGIVGLKTHTKTAIVVRHEAEGMRVYGHIGTGNYNPKTAQVYTDLGLFTCNPAITADLVDLFHYLTGRSLKHEFRTLLIAPTNMRRRFHEMIDREIALCPAWRQRGADIHDPLRPLIIAKMNSLEDPIVCRKLYEASQAGVRIKLLVRGFCCLRPGVPGMSENISVSSVIGRFLEHARIFYFHNNGQGEYYIGSADWMYRNLYYRVECITPILDECLRTRLKQILDLMLEDQRQAWDMHPDGSYTQRHPADSDSPEARGSQQRLMELARLEIQPV